MKAMLAVVFAISIVVGLGVASYAQQPTKDELVEAWLENARLVAVFANEKCSALETTHKWNETRKSVQAKIEARLPGKTVNWATFTIVDRQPRVEKE